MPIDKMKNPNDVATSPDNRTTRSDGNDPAARKPFSPPELKPHGTLDIHAGTINLWGSP